jgi:hypothetical protein
LKNAKKTEIDREENYLVKATLILDNAEINDVLCKIYLPERIQKKPYVILKPSKEDTDKIMDSHKVALKATIYGSNKEIQTTIEAPEVYFSEAHTKHWGVDIIETSVLGEPQDLHIIQHNRNHEGPEGTQIVFWISPNEFLAPRMSRSTSYTGEIKYEVVRSREFRIKDDIKIIFEKRFDSKTIENGDLVQWSSLVASADYDVPANDVNKLKNNILPDIDDLLLIASFAARKPTACLGWTAIDKNSYVTFYRGNKVLPEGNDNSSINYGVTDIFFFERFVQTCYPAFLKFENKLALRNTLYSIVPLMPQTLEASFLRMFSGMETLVLDFRRRENLEYVLPKDKWPALRKYLRKCIKESVEPKLEREQRASIYRKLDELNRISINEAFDEFCKRYAIDLEDLWPVFGTKETVGLADIRNRLIHGDPFPPDLYESLFVANEHLKYTLERVIVRILGCDVRETKVSPDYLEKDLLEINAFPAARIRLFEYIYNHGTDEDVLKTPVKTEIKKR